MSEDTPDTSGLFTPGPSFDSAPAGDKERQAIDSLRGYAYQIAASTVAWLDLDDTARLYLEVAEDYATLAADKLKAVQVKDTRGSGAITLNSQSVRDAIAHYVDLVARNQQPDGTFSLSHHVGYHERTPRRRSPRGRGWTYLLAQSGDRSGREAASRNFRRSATSLTKCGHLFGAAMMKRSGETFLRNVHWQCGQSNFSDLLRELEERLVVLGTDRYRLRAPDSKRLADVLMYHVLRKSALKDANARVLSRADLDTAVHAATSVTVQRSAVDVIIADRAASAVSGALAGGAQASLTLSSTDFDWLVPSSGYSAAAWHYFSPDRQERHHQGPCGSRACLFGWRNRCREILARKRCRAGICGQLCPRRRKRRDSGRSALASQRHSSVASGPQRHGR